MEGSGFFASLRMAKKGQPEGWLFSGESGLLRNDGSGFMNQLAGH